MYKKKATACPHCGNKDPDQQRDIQQVVPKTGRKEVVGTMCLICGVETPTR